MAPKRLSPLEEAPVPASSEEDSEEEIEDEEESEEEKAIPLSSSVKKPIGTQPPQSSSSSSEDEGSDSGSDSENPHSSDFKVKPIISKPMDDHDTAELKKPPTKSSLLPVATQIKSVTAAKRPAENDKEGKDSKRKKKKVLDADEEDDSGKKSGGDPKKQLFQRVWSEDDEIVILKGMLDYSSKKGVDPMADVNAFHDFIKKSLHADVSKDQLINKIRRLKKKYQNNAGKAKKGEDRTFTKPHEQKTFDLSKKIWGGKDGDAGDGQVKVNGKAGKKKKVSDEVVVPKPEVLAMPEVQKAEEELNWSHYPYLRESLQLGSKLNVSIPGLEESILNEGLGLIGGSKAKELEEKWRTLKVTGIEVYLKRLELMHEQMKLLLDAVNVSKP
ncbi:hypothetical protein HHK36_014531 [Tetracentron sinense]|uniref:Glabrous enhancer-binding protein-like DBD domain-containing protein n=1 Tax=Tetracentron sinense TaxID=13715 RepID=A0A834Z7J2_TETSI|nr:hypothetical protein HHK36_014531 [Tetracentron sinense]